MSQVKLYFCEFRCGTSFIFQSLPR